MSAQPQQEEKPDQSDHEPVTIIWHDRFRREKPESEDFMDYYRERSRDALSVGG